MPSNKQRREAARRKLERQLEARQERDRRRQGNLIASIVGGLLIVGVVITFIVISSREKSSDSAGSSDSAVATAAPTTGATTAAPATTYPAAQGAAETFEGVTVTGAADLGGRPEVTSAATVDPTALQFKDLVVGTGAAPTTTDSVTVQYVGVLYKDGTVFDESWKRGAPETFSLQGVVAGFTSGIAGDGGATPAMKIGGRRIIIVPASLGYGATAQGSIPANSTLVFVIDLLSVTPAAATAS